MVAAFCVVVAVVSVLRLRRGGPGPQVNWVPRALRGRVNRSYRQHGWREEWFLQQDPKMALLRVSSR